MGGFELFQMIIGVVAVLSTGGLLYALFVRPDQLARRALTLQLEDRPAHHRKTRDELEVERIKKISGSSTVESTRATVASRLYKAGYYLPRHKRLFTILHLASCTAGLLLIPAAVSAFVSRPGLLIFSAFLGFVVGYTGPLAWLERRGRERQEDTLYYLPLVIEQIAIGVSSALDVGACVSHIVDTAHERDSHNPVTEMLAHVEKLIRSGFNLQDALIEVGQASEMNEVRHAFMFMSQCSKYGGEISRQLQELADAVMIQRQVQIERRIVALPVRATGPLATIFAGFFGMVFAGLFIRVAQAFGG